MANKIPVGATIRRSYDFAFRNFLPNIGAIWIPFSFMIVCSVLLAKMQLPLLQELANQSATFNPSSPPSPAEIQKLITQMAQVGPYLSLSMILIGVCFSSIFVGLTKEALQLRKGNALLQMPFSQPVWILIGAYLLLMLILLGLYFGFVLLLVIIFVIAEFARHAPGPLSTLVTLGSVVAGIAGWCAMILAMFRLSFLVAPPVVAEESISFRRGWQPTRGNFWRIFVIWLSIFIPMLLASFGLVLVLFGGDIFPPMNALKNPEAMSSWSRHLSQMSIGMMERRLDWWVLFFPLELIFYVIIYGLWAGASAFAYQALVAGEKADAV